MNIQDAIKKVNQPKWIAKEEQEAIGKYAQLIPEHGVMLDIGGGPGTSTLIAALVSEPFFKVYSLDPGFAENENAIRPNYLIKRIKELGVEGKVFVVQGKAEDVAKHWDIQVDIILHDADHDYDNVLIQSEPYCPFLKVGGYFMWHDYDVSGYGMSKAVDEIIEKNGYERIELVNNLCITRRIK